MMQYCTLNPTTGQLVRPYELADENQIEKALEGSAQAFREWRKTAFRRRGEPLEAVADRLEEKASSLARLMAEEMGKPVAEGKAEAEKCAWACRYFAQHGPSFLSADERHSDARKSSVRYDPLGPILAIMPWNFPFWQLFRFAAPALMAGNTVLLKHAPSTPGCALAIEELFRQAGFDASIVQNLFLSNQQAAQVIGDSRLRGVTLTGSTAAGREVARTAGGSLKPVVLELGGSDPFIVFPDADLKAAVQTGAAARCQNSGQSCIAAKRFLLHESIAEDFAQGLVDAMQSRNVGNPLDESTAIGPLAREDLRETLHRQVEESLEAGARLLCGGKVPPGRGFFYPPTVLADVPADAPAANQELFGPVAALRTFRDEAQAVSLANQTAYGLGASLWTSSLERAERLVPLIEAGAVFVNSMVKSDPRLPFGGIKDSGFGRELSREGIRAFTNVKTVWID
ncbi:MAG TPA: NAD-dependent succinate-semialdehyde dehydrogenase [Acidobacteriota bacterium]|nr:NAD-dependent succinate-semialdehyde dehydrogenase [Acidobacteriota bacterium]